jgi:3-oxoacyl-[acyl-carrier protein] reductase
MLLDGKVALVTGASRGIGQAIAVALAQQGAMVIGTATSTSGARSITEQLQQLQLKGKGMVLDVANPQAIAEVLEQINRHYAAPDILINNAGITRDSLVLRMRDEDWDAVISTNLTAVYRMNKACIKDMLKARWGRIINISSIVGITGNPGQANYVAAKAGVIGLTKTLAQEVAARGITVNAVAPGFIDTDMTRNLPENYRQALLSKVPAQRLGQPEDVAVAVVFLASPSASYITGETLHINGGMYCS